MKALNFSRERIFRKLVLTYARLSRARSKGNPRKWLILTPTALGSLGDEAMVKATVRAINEEKEDIELTVLIWDERDRELYKSLNVSFFRATPFLSSPIGLKSAPQLIFTELRRLVSCLDGATKLIVIGADVLDGRYSELRSLRRMLLAEIANIRGLSTTICGFSFSDQATPATRKAFRDLNKKIALSARDPKSAERVRAITKGSVQACSDLAFLLNPSTPEYEDLNVIENSVIDKRRLGNRILCVNINRQAFGKGYDQEPQGITLAYACLLKEIGRQIDTSFILIPHDYRGKNSDEILLRRIFDEVSAELDVYMPSSRLKAETAKYFAGLADLTLTGRMHFAIASLGAGRPAMIQDYQGKVEGLLALFDLADLRIEKEAFEDPKRLGMRIARTLGESEELSQRIQERLPRIKALSKANVFPANFAK